MTRRERLERKLERRLEWAGSRLGKADSLRSVDAHLKKDHAFNTQPGRIPARERMNAREKKAYEHEDIASHHEEKAAGLASQLRRTIFSDDPDAVEQLQEKIARMEARRDDMKERNAEHRKAGKPKAHEGYELSNLGARIRTAKQRLVEAEERRRRVAKVEEVDGALIELDGNRAVITFPERPEREILDALKAACFVWRQGAWQGRWSALDADTQQAIQEWEP